MRNPGFGSWKYDDDFAGRRGDGVTSDAEPLPEPPAPCELFASLREETQEILLARLKPAETDLVIMIANGYTPRDIANVQNKPVKVVVRTCDAAERRLVAVIDAIAKRLPVQNTDAGDLVRWLAARKELSL